MSQTVDNRVVEMQFNNKNFEQNVQQSMSTLEKLNHSLGNVGNSAKHFEDLGKAASNVKLDGINSAAEVSISKFDAMGVMAKRVFENIVDMAWRFGSKIASNLSEYTFKPIMESMGEYELKMGSIQTMLNAQDAPSLEKVNEQLNKLNEYADKTIYSFSDMTQNIGKFTNAGVKLEDSVQAIQGIANVAAVSGANTNEASRAMYNFAQALSAGSVKLIDWKSIQNANMATVEFKQNLIETAVAMGTLVEFEGQYVSTTTDANGNVSDLFDSTKMFNESLSSQWMTTEVLVQTLQNYSTNVEEMTEEERKANRERLKSIGYTEEQIDSIEALGIKAAKAATEVKTFSQLKDTIKEAIGTGWADTFEIIIGDFNEAKELWTGLYAVFDSLIGEFNRFRNDILKTWKEAGGRNDLIEGFKNLYKAITEITKPVKEAFESVFGKKTIGDYANILKGFSEGFKNFTATLTPTADTLDNLRVGFAGVFNVIGIGAKTLGLFKDTILSPMATIFGDLTKVALTAFAAIGQIINDFTLELQSADGQSKPFIQSLQEIIKLFSNQLSTRLIDGIWSLSDAISRVIVGASGGIGAFLNYLKSIKDTLSEKVNFTFADALKELIVGVFVTPFVNPNDSPIIKAFRYIFDTVSIIGNALLEFAVNLSKGISSALSSMGFEGILDFIHALFGLIIGGSFAKMSYAISDIFDSLGDALEGLTWQVKSEAVMNIAKALGVLTASLYVLSSIDSDRLMSSIGAMAALMTELAIAMRYIGKSFSSGSKGTNGIKEFLNAFKDDVLGLIKANFEMKMLSTLMISFAIAIGILSAALYGLSKIDWGGIGRGLTGLTVLIIELSVATKYLSTVQNVKAGVITSLISMAISLKILASAVSDLAPYNWEQLAGAVVSIGALLLAMSGFYRILGETTSKVEGLKKTSFSRESLVPKGLSTSIIALALSIKIISSAVSELSSIDTSGLIQGMLSVGAILAGLLVFMKMIGSFSNQSQSILGIGEQTITKGTIIPSGFTTGIIALAASIKIIASAVNSLGSLDTGQIVKGLVSLAAILTSIALFMNSMPSEGSYMQIGASLVLLATSLKVVSGVVRDLSTLSWGELIKGLTGAVGGITALAIVLKALSSIEIGDSNTSLIKSAAAITVMAVALRILVPALKSLGDQNIGQMVMSLVSLAGIFTILGVAGKVLTPFIGTIYSLGGALALVGAGVALFGAGVTSIAVGIGVLAAALSGGATIIATGIKVILLEIASIIPAILGIIAQAAVALAEAFTVIIKAIAEAIVNNYFIISEAFMQVVLQSLNTLLDHGEEIANKFFDLLVLAIRILRNRTPELVEELGGLFVELFDSVSKLTNVDTVGLVGVFAGFATAIGVLGKFKTQIKDGFSAAIMVAAIMGIIGGLIIVLQELGLGEALPLVKNLGLLMDELAIAMWIVSKVPSAAAIEGALGLSAFIGILAGVVAAAGAIAQIPGAKWLVEEGGNFLEAIGNALGQFAGGIVAGGLEAASDALPKVGENLSGFMENAQVFFDGIKGFDESTGKAISSLASAVLLITGADLIEGIKNFLMGGEQSSLEKFGQQLANFAPHFKEFYNQVKDIKPDVIEASANAALSLAEFARKIPNEGGWLAKVFGENDLELFGQKLESFGPHIAAYAKCISDANIDGDAVIASANAASALAEFAKKIPNEGGWLAKVFGENDLESFGKKLADFAPHFVNYATAIKDVDGDAVIASTNAATVLSEFVNGLPKEGGWFERIFGNNDLVSFAKNLVPLGENLALYSNAVSGKIDSQSISASVNAGKSITGLYEALPKKLPIGDMKLSKLVEEIIPFGRGMSEYSAIVTQSIDTKSVTASVNAGKALSGLIEALPNGASGFDTWFTGKLTLSKLGDEIIPFGRTIVNYSSIISGNIDEAAVIASANAGKTLTELYNNLPKSGSIFDMFFGAKKSISDFGKELLNFGYSMSNYSSAVSGKGIEKLGPITDEILKLSTVLKGLESVDTTKLGGFAKGLKELAKVSINEFVKTFDNASSKVKNSAQSMLDNFISGAENRKPKVIEVFNKIATEASNVVKDKESSFQSAGQALIEKLQVGINSKKQEVNKVFTEMVDGFLKSIRDTYSSFSETGAYLIEGFLSGINSSYSQVVNAGATAVDKYSSGISNNLSKASDSGAKLINATLNKVNSDVSSFYTSGKQVVNGFTSGINDNISKAENAAKTLAKKSQAATNRTLGVKSPSREFMKTGAFCVEGLALGMKDNLDIAKEAAYEVGSSAITGSINGLETELTKVLGYLFDLISDGMNLEPVIRPVLDSSDFEKNIKAINSAFNKTTDITLSTKESVKSKKSSNSNVKNNDETSNTYNFTQNNYSPKALSRIEIYRQTRNQFSRLREQQ